METPSETPRRFPPTGWGWPVVMGIVYFAVGLLIMSLTRNEGGITTMWFPSGILLAALLLTRPERVYLFIMAGAIASMAVNLTYGSDVATSAAYTIGNALEPLVVLFAFRDGEGPRLPFNDPRLLGRFAGSATVGAAAGAIVVALFSGDASPAAFLSWFTTDLLGMLVVTPVIVVARKLLTPRRRAAISRAQVIEAIALLAGVAGVTTAVFLQSRYPLLFLPMMAMLFTVFRLGPIGAALSVLLIASISSAALILGTTPLSVIKGAYSARVLFLQLYLFALLASSMPLAALLAARDGLARKLTERNRLLNQAERAAKLGHCRINRATRTIFWSREVFNIHGRAEDDPPSAADALNYYHIDDRERVNATMLGAMKDGQPFEFVARIVRTDGAMRHVLVRGEADRDAAGNPIGLFGMMQDITQQVESEREIRAAQQAAERAAAEAMVLADTDQLTGLANRRRTFHLLDQALATSRSSAHPLSVAIFDIDHFKAINDTFGHAAGDTVLRRVARAAEESVRANDVVGRIGGEEFVVILPISTAFTALAVAERLRAAVEASTGRLGQPPATISIGVATLREGEDVEALLKRTDAALYDAKRTGRNRLQLAA